MTSQAAILLGIATFAPLMVCLLAWKVTRFWLWRVLALGTALVSWGGVLLFATLLFGSSFAYANVNAVVPVSAAALAANVSLGVLFVWFWLRQRMSGGEK